MNVKELKDKMVKSCTLFNLGMPMLEIATKLKLTIDQVNYFINIPI